MPVLNNARHEQFAVGVASGMPATKAYIAAGYAPKAAESNASRLMGNDKVKARIAELRREISQKAVAKTALTRQYVIRTLMHNVDGCMVPVDVTNARGEVVGMAPNNPNAANTALIALGKELGMFVDKQELGRPGEFKSLEEMDARKAELDRRLAELEAEEAQAVDTVH